LQADDPANDWNGDGVLDACSSPNYCQSTGAVMDASGSPLIADNDFTLIANQVPLHEWGYFLMSGSKGFIPGFGGSMGTLCLGPPIYRFVKPPSGQVLNSGPTGQFVFKTDLNILPQGVVFAVGSSWHFQAWFREVFSSNTTDGIEVMFR
jgi:hypothetical protein